MEKTFQEAEFDWDEHNLTKNWTRHRVRFTEAEEVFFDPGLKILPDQSHSTGESRTLALGCTPTGRMLFVVFTVRRGRIRVISARDMNKSERKIYHEKIKEDPSV